MLTTIPFIVVGNDVLDIGKPVLMCPYFLQHLVEVSMQLTTGGLNAVDVVSVPRYDFDDEFVGDQVLPESGSW